MAKIPGEPPWKHVPAGSKSRVTIDVCRQGDGTQLQLQLLVLKGASVGPTLLFFGAIHGDEYEGPAALWQMYDLLNPGQLSGTVVFLPVANPPAFGAGLRTAPSDGKDLARTFPGVENGSVTEQIAYRLHHEVIPHANFLCDFHSAGRFYRISPWVGYGLVDNLHLLEQQRQAAKVCGYPDAWGTQLLPGRSLWSAAQWKVPAIYTEAPGEGRAAKEDIERNCTVVRQLLSLYEVWQEPLADLQAENIVEDQRENSGYLQIQLVAKDAGYFRPCVQLGDWLHQRDRMGEIIDPGGQVLQTVEAPTTGKLVFLRTFPVVNPGDSLGTVRDEK